MIGYSHLIDSFDLDIIHNNYLKKKKIFIIDLQMFEISLIFYGDKVILEWDQKFQ